MAAPVHLDVPWLHAPSTSCHEQLSLGAEERAEIVIIADIDVCGKTAVYDSDPMLCAEARVTGAN
jgi:hypothetical protein